MNRSHLAIWALVPLGAWAYHEGPGQDLLKLDRADALAQEAWREACDGEWRSAVATYDEAIAALPDDGVEEARRLRLERSKARMQAAGLPEAREELEELVLELQDDDAADPALLRDARSALANAQYYMTWLMRLEGLAREEWEPEVEAARQTYRLLAEDAEARGDDADLARNRTDLESAIRLARMELSELQGLPLPNP